jgi:hypothetical protein
VRNLNSSGIVWALTPAIFAPKPVIGTPAHSLAGIIAKARQGREVGDEERFGVALIANLLALGTEHAGKAPSIDAERAPDCRPFWS